MKKKDYMRKTSKKTEAEKIAEMADAGKDISSYFSNKGKIKYPIQKVNVDFTYDMLKELDAIASELNISRQAVIKMYLRQAMDQHYLAKKKAG